MYDSFFYCTQHTTAKTCFVCEHINTLIPHFTQFPEVEMMQSGLVNVTFYAFFPDNLKT